MKYRHEEFVMYCGFHALDLTYKTMLCVSSYRIINFAAYSSSPGCVGPIVLQLYLPSHVGHVEIRHKITKFELNICVLCSYHTACTYYVCMSTHTHTHTHIYIRVYQKVYGLATQSLELSATRCSCIAILWVSVVSFAAITLYVASQRVFIVVSIYFIIDSVRKLLDTPSCVCVCARARARVRSRLL
jgi:hypothetical protein